MKLWVDVDEEEVIDVEWSVDSSFVVQFARTLKLGNVPFLHEIAQDLAHASTSHNRHAMTPNSDRASPYPANLEAKELYYKVCWVG